MQKKKMITVIISVLLGVLAFLTEAGNNANKVDAWIHVHPSRLDLRFKEYKKFGKRAKEAGYSTVIIRFTNKMGYDKNKARELIKYYKNDLGLKVIPEFKLLGRSNITFGTKFLNEHPELFVGHVLDPYAKYKGKPAFDSLIIPMVDDHIRLFENPEYILLGWDEYNHDDIKTVADRNNKKFSDVWAGTLNRVNDYLIARNITPLFWSDQLISEQLAKAGNSAGYPADKRFKNYSSMHGVRPARSKIDTIEFVKDIKNKDKIAIIDRHYKYETEYPSIEYFKWLGFKEIIPATWGLDENMKYFSKYEHKHNKGPKKMLTTVWHYSYHPTVRHMLWPTIDNSILYFNNPDMKIPAKPHISVTKNNKPVLSAKPGDTVTLKISPGGNKSVFEIYPTYKMLRKNVITLKSHKPEVKWSIPQNAREGLWTIQGYSRRKDAYLLHGMLEGGIYISSKELHLKKQKKNAYMSVDFSSCKILDGRNILIDGSCESNFVTLEGNASVQQGYLLCKKGGVLINRSNFDCDSMSNDKAVLIEFKVDKFPDKAQEGSCLLTWGNYGNGFRIILWRKKLYVQIFGTFTQRKRLISSKKLEVGKKYRMFFNMNNKEATLYLNGIKEDKIKISSMVKCKIQPLNPLLIGFSLGRKFKIEECFNGKVYRFAIWNKYIGLQEAK